ncbi:MAG: flippase-like domain-containing protein [Ferrovibrio sp.]|uniref:lysylphosphatidylglycerol synthase transmembrane domain-containing protein n=1 Tax=Ferrovibrio sp. TaxID=1917215 RepID=UPI00261B5847|nr:lysylphosphatidylglycerol synthase transmembrane domain-containing protein [Ferrovibrio sp.]MCW0232984.1 flippase-like domain-containing protein [Ferrovibrio sp.]
MARGLRTFLLALVSLGSLLATLYLVGVETVIETLRSIHWLGIVGAALLILINSLLSLLRFRSVLRGFGFSPGWRSLFFAHSIGQVSNQILLNVIGQSLSRAAALAVDGVPFSASVIATYWERIQAAAILFLLSLASLWYLFFNIHLDLAPAGLSMVSLSAALAVTSIVVAVTVLRPAGAFDNLSNRLRIVLRLWPGLLLTLFAHGCMLGAYLSLLWGLGLTQIDGGMVAALIIVMFTSSLPISFSGWGIRELSAAQALGAVGVGESTAVASAVAIGLLYLFLVVIFAAVSTAIMLRHRKKYATPQPAAATAATPTIDWSKLGLTACSLLCAMFLFFQLRIPLRSGELTANIADLIALTCLGLAPYFLWTHRRTLPLPKILLAGLTAVSAVIVFALLYGYSRFGWTNWAFFNRGFGWLIILGYVATGLSITLTGNEQHRRVILAAFVATGAATAALQLILLLTILSGVRIPHDVFSLPLQGYAGNTNAFAVQMIMTAAAAIAAHHLGIFGRRKYFLPLILSLAGSSIYFCHSRAGLGMFAIALAVMMLFPASKSRRSLLPALLWPIIAIIFSSQLYLIYGFVLAGIPKLFTSGKPAIADSNYVNIVTSLLQVSMERQSGDLERWTSILEGWDMWLESPLIGNGLGAYMQHRLATTGGALIIHSVPVWLLAETGLVGFCVVAGSFAGLLVYAWRLQARPTAAGWGAGLMIALVCIAAGSAVHDFFFQRSFWFLLGLFIAMPVVSKSPGKA